MAVAVQISTLVPPGMDPDDLSPMVTVEYFTTDGTALAGQSTCILCRGKADQLQVQNGPQPPDPCLNLLQLRFLPLL